MMCYNDSMPKEGIAETENNQTKQGDECMKKIGSLFLAGALGLNLAAMGMSHRVPIAAAADKSCVVENLDRGICAINTGSGVLVNWRFLANDPDDAVFRLYRGNTLVYTSDAGDATSYLDKGGSASDTYRVEMLSGGTVQTNDTCKLTSNTNYFQLNLDPPTSSGCTYSPNDCSVGDADGDGQYEIFLKWDPSNSQDNSKGGKTDKVYIDCIKLDGTRLWRIDLGWNIRAGAHYTQMLVADYDLDGIAELVCKTSDGTVDGTGKVIGDGSKVYRNSKGYILTGPEYLTLFDGKTGAALDTINYNPGRGTVSAWGDKYGNRVDRFLGAVMYLDGERPSAVTVRGYYTRMTACAYDVVDKKLKQRWYFDTGNSSSAQGYGDGNHNCMPADVDGDGKQELILGATCLDDDGKVLWCTNKGHGDALHVGDLLPNRPGIEVWVCHEDKPYGVSLLDGKTGQTIFHVDGSSDTGRCCADNVWAGNAGAEFWGLGNDVFNGSGTKLSMRRPAINFLSYWDGDLEREILDGYTDSPATISKVKTDGTLTTLLTTDGYYTCNTTKGTPCLSADLFGDWREELIVRASDGKSIRIYCTPYDTDYRITTLMHDVQYRTQVAGQNIAYNQPPHPSFYLGSDQPLPARPTVTVLGGTPLVPGKTGAVIDTAHTYRIRNVNSGLCLEVADGTAANGTNVQQGNGTANGWQFRDGGDGYYYLYSRVGDGNTYLLDLDYGKTDNGTNIGIYSNTHSDAQLFKLVDNGDGSYTITTKATKDASCIGVTGGSKDNGANVVQWACDGSDNQKWTLEIVVDPMNGTLFRDVQVLDTAHYQNWKLGTNTGIGSLLFGDRDVVYAALPEQLQGAEALLTACDSKNVGTDLATFTAGADMTVYVLLDSRVATVPAWLSTWNKTELTAANDKDVSFVLYSRDAAAGEKITLGTNGQSAGCVNYTVLAVEQAKSIQGDVNGDGSVSVSDAVLLQQYLIRRSALTADQAVRADLNGDGAVNAFDLVLLRRLLAK